MLVAVAARRFIACRGMTHLGITALRSFVSSPVVSMTDSITYSGGQASEGQGGFYGSGGARVIQSSDVDSSGRQELLALAADVEKISAVMDELYLLESNLEKEKGVTNKSIEIKASIKKLMTSAEVMEALDRLEIQGDLVWGLSTEEREMILLAREKMNEC